MNIKEVTLPSFLKPKKSKNLIRLGKKNDGGYLVEKEDVIQSDLLISFGISDDWSFEESFYICNNLDIYAYDGSLSKKFWLKKYLYFFLNLKINRLLDYFRFKIFFKKNKHFIFKFLSFYNDNFNINLENIFNDIGYRKHAFIKMDIEGNEYRILDDLLKFQNNISCLVIEFHDVDLHLKRIEKFISNFDLKIIHIHVNNYSLRNLIVPNVIEITFSRIYLDQNNDHPKNSKDSPNSPKYDDFEINFNS